MVVILLGVRVLDELSQLSCHLLGMALGDLIDLYTRITVRLLALFDNTGGSNPVKRIAAPSTDMSGCNGAGLLVQQASGYLGGS